MNLYFGLALQELDKCRCDYDKLHAYAYNIRIII